MRAAVGLVAVVGAGVQAGRQLHASGPLQRTDDEVRREHRIRDELLGTAGVRPAVIGLEAEAVELLEVTDGELVLARGERDCSSRPRSIIGLTSAANVDDLLAVDVDRAAVVAVDSKSVRAGRGNGDVAGVDRLEVLGPADAVVAGGGPGLLPSTLGKPSPPPPISMLMTVPPLELLCATGDGVRVARWFCKVERLL